MNKQELFAEVKNDPANIGYAPFLAKGDHTAVAKLLNAKTQSLKVTHLDGADSIDCTELELLTPQVVSFILSGPRLFSDLKVAFEAAPKSTIRLLATENYPASRAEELFGTGVVISESDLGGLK